MDEKVSQDMIDSHFLETNPKPNGLCILVPEAPSIPPISFLPGGETVAVLFKSKSVPYKSNLQPFNFFIILKILS